MVESKTNMMVLGIIMLNNKILGYRVFNINTGEFKDCTDYQVYEMLRYNRIRFTNMMYDEMSDTIKYTHGNVDKLPRLDAISKKVIQNGGYFVIGKTLVDDRYIVRLVNTNGTVRLCTESSITALVLNGKLNLINGMVRGFRGSDIKHILGIKHAIPTFNMKLRKAS